MVTVSTKNTEAGADFLIISIGRHKTVIKELMHQTSMYQCKIPKVDSWEMQMCFNQRLTSRFQKKMLCIKMIE